MVMTFVISLVAVGAFALVLGRAGIERVASQVIQTTTAGLSTMMDPELDDDIKEIAVRRAGLALLRFAFGLFWRFACALAAAAAPIYGADAIGMTTVSDVVAVMMRLDYIVVVSVVMILAVTLFRRLRGPAGTDTSANSHYSDADRFFHELAFSTPAVLKAVSWIEDKTTARAVPETVQAPIFITSLARGGTTALLNALCDLPGLATHIYRDMPFLTAPVLWHRLSGGDKRQVKRHQRAHGDGLEIDLDTPEAFEEVVWKVGWPKKYHTDGIDLWNPSDHSPKAERFLRHHMAKIIQARHLQGHIKQAPTVRYLSKNNANITRIGFLQDSFPDCKIIVPVRRPQCHVASLLRQHHNFLKQHDRDDFVRRYMRDIGHFEFGKIHRPFLFPGFAPDQFNATQGDYWLQYWICTFRHLLDHRNGLIFVLQDDLRARPQATMRYLCHDLGVAPGDVDFGQFFRSEPDVAATTGFNPELFKDACALYDQIVHIAAT